jgi:UDP-N-acetyl-2-amino-2-deoxyglucuronate dehydrogenase
MSGVLRLARANVRWFLSTDANDLPTQITEQGGFAYRSMTYDGQEIEFSKGFTDLHTRVYQDILSGGGFGLTDALPAIELAHGISNAPEIAPGGFKHPMVSGKPQPLRVAA